MKIKLEKVKLLILKIEMGPEAENLLFSESKKDWDRRINSFIKDIESGYERLTLIITNFWSELDLSDGSHRHEALLRLGLDNYWAIFFLEDK